MYHAVVDDSVTRDCIMLLHMWRACKVPHRGCGCAVTYVTCMPKCYRRDRRSEVLHRTCVVTDVTCMPNGLQGRCCVATDVTCMPNGLQGRCCVATDMTSMPRCCYQRDVHAEGVKGEIVVLIQTDVTCILKMYRHVTFCCYRGDMHAEIGVMSVLHQQPEPQLHHDLHMVRFFSFFFVKYLLSLFLRGELVCKYLNLQALFGCYILISIQK